MMKEQEIQVVQEKKLNKKGFSLVELIVVIAIMAIMVGIVGTQVLPYIEKSRQSKDYQIISGVCTAATTSYAAKAAYIDPTADDTVYSFKLFTTTSDVAEEVRKQVLELIGFEDKAKVEDFAKKMDSKVGKAIAEVNVKYTPSTGEVMVSVTGKTGASSNWKDGIFDPVSSK